MLANDQREDIDATAGRSKPFWVDFTAVSPGKYQGESCHYIRLCDPNTGDVRSQSMKCLQCDLSNSFSPTRSVRLEGELTSVKISQDSRYALINHAPDVSFFPILVYVLTTFPFHWLQEVQLWDLDSARMVRKFTGQRQGQHVIRSCFGGIDGNFIVSGSEGMGIFSVFVSCLKG